MKLQLSLNDCLVLLFSFLLCFHDLIISSVSFEEKGCGRGRLCASEASVDVKPQEESSLCLVNVG